MKSRLMHTFALGSVPFGLMAGAPSLAQEAPSAGVTAYTGAMVFDEKGFSAQSLCVEGDFIVECPVNPSSSVSRAGQYITPPFGDAYTHHFDGVYTLDWHRSIAIKAGAF